MAKVLHHSHCHYINGERLYYILISYKYNAFNSAKRLIGEIKESKLEDTTCAHYVFGDLDVIIRLWANEDDLIKVMAIIEKYNNLESKRILLIDSINTWYQKNIEKKIKKTCFDEKTINEILNVNIAPKYLYVYRAKKKDESRVKFWIFIDEPFSSNSYFFSKLSEMLKKAKQPEEFDGIYNVSLYSYISKSFRGTIIKADSDNFIESCDNLASLT